MSKFLFSLLLVSFSIFAAEEHATMSLSRANNKLVVTINHDEGWHTYWKNPGDAGIASVFKFSSAGKPLVARAYEWPLPEKHIEAGDILTIGYGGKQHFFFDDMPGTIDAHVAVLICKDICIPGEAKLQLAAGQNFVSNRQASPFSNDELNKAFSELPQDAMVPANFEYYLTRVKDQNLLTLHYSLKGLKNFNLPKKLNLLTAFPAVPFGYKRESLFIEGDTLYGKTEIEWDGEYQEPVVGLPASGSFPQNYELPFLFNAPGKKTAEKIILKVKDFSLASPSLDQFYKKLKPLDPAGKEQPVAASSSNDMNMFQYLMFAFLGGLILNLMPCVLPVISLKLFSLIRHKDYSQKQLLKHNLSYTAGVISTFMGLAGVIVALKATGEEVGWGFQLQSPTFILSMMLVLFILSLNLFGLFEFITPGGSKLGNAKTEDGFVGDFFGGVLTTILSTPCSAPFLGTALTFALTSSSTTIFLMFLFIGLGLAFPFLLTAIIPGALAIFPRPGAWMEKLKYFLGLSLIATVVWLYDVFASLVDYDAISWRLNLLFVFWFFAFFFMKKISANKILLAIVFFIPLSMTIMAVKDLELKPTTASEVAKESLWKPWSEQKAAELKGQNVFMDFTAEWCLTCKVNKKLVLETDGFNELAKKNNIVLLRADWTKRDDNITQYLKKYGAVGVPAYFVQKANGEVVFLGETISLEKIEKSL
jgi:thiol:disulfide interchange protein/DsbC/DsbD-like thiol-disulfide interchange protein